MQNDLEWKLTQNAKLFRMQNDSECTLTKNAK